MVLPGPGAECVGCERGFENSPDGVQDPTQRVLADSGQSGLGTYDPRLTFAPLALPDPVNAYRSSNGAPGPQYWQNEADYDLHATLDTEHKQLRATETIIYTNNSPDALPSLWVQLDQNIYREDSRAHIISAGSPRPRRRGMQQLRIRMPRRRRLRRRDSSSIRSRLSRAGRRRRRII